MRRRGACRNHMIWSRRAASVIPIVLIDTSRGIRTLDPILTNLPLKSTYGSRTATLALSLLSTCIKDLSINVVEQASNAPALTVGNAPISANCGSSEVKSFSWERYSTSVVIPFYCQKWQAYAPERHCL